MPFIPCPHCQKEISDQALQCPQCHQAVKPPTPAAMPPAAARDGIRPSEPATPQRIPRGPVILGVLTIVNAMFFGQGLVMESLFPTPDLFAGGVVSRGLAAIGTAISIVHFFAAIGLLLHQPWARWALMQLTIGIVLLTGLAITHLLIAGPVPTDLLLIMNAPWAFLLHALLRTHIIAWQL